MKRRNFVGLLGAGTVGWSLPKAAYSDVAESILDGEATQEDPRFRAIAALVEAKMAEYRVPGVALGILKGGVLTMRGFGLTNLDNPQPVTPETVFPIASITKTVVTVAMLRMVDEGRVDLDGPIVEYLPEFRLRDPDASHQVTIRHLLTHTPGWEGDLAFLEGFDGSVLEAFVGSLVDVPFLAPPGEVWGYNNAGFNVAGRVLEVVTGRSIREVLSDLVFSPLGLSRAFTRTGDALLYRFAAPHLERDGATRVDRPFELPATTASGGAAMSLASLMAYASFHLGDGTAPSGERLLTRSSLELMRTPQLVKRPTTGWALAFTFGVWAVC
jgi:CubicO group peptidase (beta-lactamase class C family)